MQRGHFARLGRLNRAQPAEMVDHLQQVWRGDHLGRFDPSGLGAAGCRAVERLAQFGCFKRGRKRADHRVEPAIQRQLADGNRFADRIARHHFKRGQKRKRDRKIKMGSGFGQIRRGEVYGDFFGRKSQRQIIEHSANTLAGFADGFVGQSDNGKTRQAGADGTFHIHLARLHTFKGHGMGAGDHKIIAMAKSVFGQMI